MIKALEIFSAILKEYLSLKFNGFNNINPIELNKERFRIRAAFIAVIIYLKNNNSRKSELVLVEANEWLKLNFHKENFFSSILNDIPEDLSSIIESSFAYFSSIDDVDIITLYEDLLSIESYTGDIETTISNAKNYRNKLGSYYTPKSLARKITQRTIDTFFELNYNIENLSNSKKTDISKELLDDLKEITFADFSCGGGIFLLEVISYFETLFEKSNLNSTEKDVLLVNIAKNIYAFDVDCIALEVAKILLALKINKTSSYSLINCNFNHCNFLLHSDFEESSLEKQKIFSSGFIYHSKLSVENKNLRKIDVILGNPPWEKIRFEEKKFYALYDNIISNVHFKSSRIKEIKKLKDKNVELAEFSNSFKEEIDLAKVKLKKDNFFNLSHKGELNTYALFTDAAYKLKTNRGVVGLVLKSSIVTSQVNKLLFNTLSKSNSLIAIYDFINRKKIFNIDSRERFCFLLLGNSKTNSFSVSMNLLDSDHLDNTKSSVTLSSSDLFLINPLTGMLPNFSNKDEINFLIKISKNNPYFEDVYGDVKFGRIVHFTSHSAFITKRKTSENLGIFEGKFFNQFDNKYSGFNEVADKLRYGNKSSSRIINDSEKKEISFYPESRYFISKKKWIELSKNHTEDYMLSWRSLTSATNTRTCIASVLPFIPASQSVQFLTTNKKDLFYLNGLFNSIVFDFIMKKKINGIDLTQKLIKQVPIPSNELLDKKLELYDTVCSIKNYISFLVSLLYKNDIKLLSLVKEYENNNSILNNLTRFEIIRYIDLLFIYIYQLNNSEIELILHSFKKQYSNKDLEWFVKNKSILLNNSKKIRTTAIFSP
tara:strand:- start:626 stop:3106 length:2481 start_codon:yes stop_codon:yes gene_type:complete